MDSTSHETQAMRRALLLARTPGVPLGPNPRVGCVLLSPEGVVLAEGFHRGAGSAHAEVAALSEAGVAARGATAVVTLEPCNHTGRTGPCTEALINAGIRRVVFAQPDPNPLAAGGEERLQAAGIEVSFGLLEREARAINRAWTFAVEHHRPFVTWKYAASLDGRSAAADGSSKWITSSVARQDAHRHRAECDVIMVGTTTALVDDPKLTVRNEYDEPSAHQPLRAVMGLSELPSTSRVFNDSAETVLLQTQDPRSALHQLYQLGRQHVFLEGGPTLAAAFIKAGLIDEVLAYIAPTLMGAGPSAIADLGITNIGDSLRLTITDVTTLGSGSEANVRITMSTRRK